MSGAKVVVIGQGYVGLPVAMRAVDVGYDVVGFDLDKRKIDGLNAGKSHIDDITDADIAAALATGRYVASIDEASVANFDIAVITVPTPLRDGAPDLSYIESAGEILGRALRPGATVILESTTFPGTTEEVLAPILDGATGLTHGTDYQLGFSPERIDPGNTEWDFKRTPKVVSGVNATSLAAVKEFYDNVCDTTVPVSGTREAELAKLLENTFRHVNIALVNEIGIHARALGIDMWDVIDAAKTKPFGFMPFYPGPGVGGHCLPIDPSYLSWQVERTLRTVSRFVKIANDVNDHMPDYVVKRVQLGLNKRKKAVNGANVLVLGVAYKKNSNDARETPSTQVIEQLLELGANVTVHDSHVDGFHLDAQAARVDLTIETIKNADAIVLITDHDDVDYDLILANADYIFDARHRIFGDNVEQL
ncbi:MAG: nucleotide sugar dehydrogenase [Acidimicrobiales bacterium]